MAVMIKNMSMPERCDCCRLCEGDTMDGLCHGAGKWFDDEYFRWFQYEEDDVDTTKPLNCPLVEVKEPKRNADADKLLEEAGWE